MEVFLRWESFTPTAWRYVDLLRRRNILSNRKQLNSLDNMKVDGKFVVNGDIPEGQGSVTELLAECFDLNYELRVAAEMAAESGETEV